MKLSDDLTALVFELQRARSPGEKARALARAWRTVRGLSPTERRLLAREVGFDGAEDLVEGLAGKSGGAVAPAAVLEALGRMRKDENLSLRGILAGLRDPEQREDLFVRGIDLLTGVEDEAADDETERVLDEDAVVEEDDVVREAEVFGGEVELEDETAPDVGRAAVAVDEPVPFEPTPPRPSRVDIPRRMPTAAPETDAVDEPEPGSKAGARYVDPSTWDELWLEPPTGAPIPMIEDRQSETRFFVEEQRRRAAPDSVFKRLRAFRDGIEGFRGAGDGAAIAALEALPEAWAKRRAVVALLEAGIPSDPVVAVDLIESLERPMDRGWCLSALARRGDLGGDDLERALGLLASPAARRRVRALVAAGG